jgi:hypothetical protein
MEAFTYDRHGTSCGFRRRDIAAGKRERWPISEEIPRQGREFKIYLTTEKNVLTGVA